MRFRTLITFALLASILSELRVIRNNQEETMKSIEELTQVVVGLEGQVDSLNAVLVELDADVVKILDMLKAGTDTTALEAALTALADKTSVALGAATATEDKADDVLPEA